jgi:hypothetical protein|tara:strand:+ start:377 stop:526 length:150 start_codon:yes stop_codon:yes gene_type:complete
VLPEELEIHPQQLPLKEIPELRVLDIKPVEVVVPMPQVQVNLAEMVKQI